MVAAAGPWRTIGTATGALLRGELAQFLIQRRDAGVDELNAPVAARGQGIQTSVSNTKAQYTRSESGAARGTGRRGRRSADRGAPTPGQCRAWGKPVENKARMGRDRGKLGMPAPHPMPSCLMNPTPIVKPSASPTRNPRP